jgi:hypothetical protein
MYIQKVLSRKTFIKLVFCWRLDVLKVNEKIVGSGSASGSGSGSISRRYGSADPDPDPHQNVKDPEHWFAR